MIKHVETDSIRLTREDHDEQEGMLIAPTLSGDGRRPLWLTAEEFDDLAEILIRLRREPAI